MSVKLSQIKHIKELYRAGKTTFRDVNGEYPDYVFVLCLLVERWSLGNRGLIEGFLMRGDFASARNSFDKYVSEEIKQSCIDYYGDE